MTSDDRPTSRFGRDEVDPATELWRGQPLSDRPDIPADATLHDAVARVIACEYRTRQANGVWATSDQHAAAFATVAIAEMQQREGQ